MGIPSTTHHAGVPLRGLVLSAPPPHIGGGGGVEHPPWCCFRRSVGASWRCGACGGGEPAVTFQDRGSGEGTVSQGRAWVVVGGVQLGHTLIQRWDISADGWRPFRSRTSL
jgi:hypothetical protein